MGPMRGATFNPYFITDIRYIPTNENLDTNVQFTMQGDYTDFVTSPQFQNSWLTALVYNFPVLYNLYTTGEFGDISNKIIVFTLVWTFTQPPIKK